jgi:hypothetical protein
MARLASFHLIQSFRERLCGTLEDAVKDCEIVANGVLADVVMRRLREGEVGNFAADAREDIEKAVNRAANRSRALIRDWLGRLPSIITEVGRGGARNVKHVWTDKERACLAAKYAELQPIWIEAKRIARHAQESPEAKRQQEWRKEVLAVYDDLPIDLLERFVALRADDAKPSDIAVIHAGRLCLPPNVTLSVIRLRKELTAWKNKSL